MREIKLAVVLASLALAGCGGFTDLFGSKQAAAITPPCSRSPLEVIIARAGMACSDTNPCPSGSYCNASAVCAWACYADSECATGQVCGCDGRCVGDNPSGTDGGAPTTDLSCSKDPTLLYRIKPGSSPQPIAPVNCDAQGLCPAGAQCNPATHVCDWVRECENDLRCPAGSYCDPATGRCSWDCHPNVACPTANQVCNCSGRCVIPGTSPGAGDPTCQPRQMVTLAVSPRTSFIGGAPTTPATWSRTVELTLSAPTEQQLVGFSAMGGLTMKQSTQTYVVPRENTQVLCNGTWTSSSCSVTRAIVTTKGTAGWLYESLGQAPDPVTKRATILVDVRATPNVAAPGWHADVFVPGAQNSPQGLDFVFTPESPSINGQAAPVWQAGLPAENISYQGRMVIRGPNDPTPSTSGTTPESMSPSSVPIVAKTLGNQLFIFDATRTISASGTLTLENGSSPPFYLAKTVDPRQTMHAHGSPFAILSFDPVSKAVRGEFSVMGFGNGTVSFGATLGLTPIPAGQPAPVIPTEPVPPPFENAYAGNSIWLDSYISTAYYVAIYGARVSSMWLNDIYSYTAGVSSPVHVSKPPLIFADQTLSEYPPNAGQEACGAAFVNGYVEELKRPWTIAGHTYQNDVFIPRPQEIIVGSFCSLPQVYATQEQRDTWLPCVDGPGVEPVLRSQSSFNLSANCQGFYDNQQYSGFPVGKSYSNWLAQDCRLITSPSGFERFTVTMHDVTAGNAVVQTHISDLYICPQFKRSLVRIPTGLSSAEVVRTDSSPAAAAFCYEPSQSGGTLQWSGNLTDGGESGNILDFSGDLLCRGPFNTTYAPRMFPLLTHADRVARGEFFASNGDSAADLFDACLRELREPAPNHNLNDLSAGAIFGTTLKTFSDAACISMPRFGMALGSFRAGASNLSGRDRKLLGHLVKQWIAVHSFVSYQGLEESNLRRVLASATDATKSPVTTSSEDPSRLAPINLEGLIDLVNQSWEPIFGLYLFSYPDLVSALGAPDYRDWSGSLATDPVLKASQDQWLPLPVLMIEGLNQELRLLRAYLEQARLTTYSADATGPNSARDQVLARYGATIRLMYLIEGVAGNLWSSNYPPIGAWERWWTAVHEMQGLREDVRRIAGGLSTGRNPLGIEEDDLPIFFGDPQGTNSQYFASSDYLVNQWATPAVNAAEASINAARDAWLQARNSKIQDRMTQTQRDQRVEDLKGAQGQKIVENCGLTGIDAQDVLDAFEGGTGSGPTLQLGTCFVDPACLSRVRLTATDVANKLTPQQVQFRLCTLKETAGYRSLPEPMATCANTGNIDAGCAKIDLYNDFNSGLVPPDALRRAELTCQARLNFRAPLPSAQDLAGPIDPSCFRGKLGAAAIQILSARQDCDLAFQNWDLAEQSFRLEAQYCSQVEAAEDEAADRAELLHDWLEDAAEAKFSAEFTLIGMEAMSGWLGGIGSAISTYGGSVASGFVGLLEQGPKIEKLLAEDSMDRAQRDYNEAMALKQASDTIRACWHGADKSHLQITAAFAQISRRTTDITTATNQFQTLMNENVQAVRQGTNDVKREKNRYISTVSHHYWADEKIDRFNKDFTWAKRMTYLAMRAVEYEFQQSLPLRRSVLTASHPNQLQDALRTLQQEVGTRTINRRRPSESSIVLSLRDELMALPDHTADQTGERQLTAMRGLQQRLTDPRFAINDKDGRWLGQGIPFNLGPEGALNYRCGERLWRVTATVQGDGLSESQPGVSLLVLKRNTFASQWCRGQGDGDKFQYGSVQPSRRLFGEQGTSSLESQANGFSTALLYPWFNIRRTDFYKDSYRDGASEELAGRGLYGDYILLFPRDVLEGTANETDACVATRRGFPLDQVEDVLVRFDYLSVDNLSDLQQ